MNEHNGHLLYLLHTVDCSIGEEQVSVLHSFVSGRLIHACLKDNAARTANDTIKEWQGSD